MKKQIAKKKKMQKQIKKENNEEKNAKIVRMYLCPNCRSANVQRIFTFRNIFGLHPMWKCQKCSYEAEIFPLLSVDVNKLNKKKLKKSK